MSTSPKNPHVIGGAMPSDHQALIQPTGEQEEHVECVTVLGGIKCHAASYTWTTSIPINTWMLEHRRATGHSIYRRKKHTIEKVQDPLSAKAAG
ncbi:hypothetical protein [Streptomyces sp. NPDC045470]|uniref:hypothetical protein n=1 Tax=Streptomyces sp. NPDC045470 TaxID=3155469 RepID=UPI0033CECE86